jgi:hypothetical protein
VWTIWIKLLFIRNLVLADALSLTFTIHHTPQLVCACIYILLCMYIHPTVHVYTSYCACIYILLPTWSAYVSCSSL